MFEPSNAQRKLREVQHPGAAKVKQKAEPKGPALVVSKCADALEIREPACPGQALSSGASGGSIGPGQLLFMAVDPTYRVIKRHWPGKTVALYVAASQL